MKTIRIVKYLVFLAVISALSISAIAQSTTQTKAPSTSKAAPASAKAAAAAPKAAEPIDLNSATKA